MDVNPHPYDQVVYLLQGGGALGSYQVGVCEALLNFGCVPDWVVGTSIGSINGAIIAGNKPQHRIAKLKEFWNTIVSPMPIIPAVNDFFQKWLNLLGAQYSAVFGQPGFFKPRLINPWFISGTPDQLSYYDTSELRITLEKVIDFDLINEKKIHFTVGAVNAKNGSEVFFDNFREEIIPEHIMASSALPPGFPAIKIGDEYFWDGGISSNTPFRVVLEERIPKKLLCFIINLYTVPDFLPKTMMDVMKAKKELEYASRHQEVLHYFCELHFLQNTVSFLSKNASNIKDQKLDLALRKIAKAGHPTSLNIIRFHYHDRTTNLWYKDFNFSLQALREHWEAGFNDAKKH